MQPYAREVCPEAIEIECRDRVRLAGHVWPQPNRKPSATVVINAATGVRADYYARYAGFLAAHGFDVLTYDYRGIGRSRPARLQGSGFRWADWGRHDFDAVVGFAKTRRPDLPILVVGHSIGGALPGLAENAVHVRRILSVGGQSGYWPDYADPQRTRLFWKWHVAMPLITAVCGYFPGRRLGWLEDLPAGVAYDWSFQRGAIERNHRARDRAEVLGRHAAVTAPILAITVSDDPFATPAAVRRMLSCYANAPTEAVMLSPADLGREEVGHFGLFHSDHASGFWLDTLAWLRDGVNPWPDRGLPPSPRARPAIVRYY